MKKIVLISVGCYSLLAISYLLMPLAASAAAPFPYFGGDPPIVSCTGVNCNVCDFFETGQRIIYFMTSLTFFVIAPIMITAGGVMIMISAGNETRLDEGKKIAYGAIIGIFITLAAFLIVNTLLKTIVRTIPGAENDNGSGFTISCVGAKSPFVPPDNQPSQNLQNVQCNSNGCYQCDSSGANCWTVPTPSVPPASSVKFNEEPPEILPDIPGGPTQTH